jgi:predicted nucleic acid-binding protein
VIVVDTNTIAYLYLPSRYTAMVNRVLEKDASWAAPLLWRSELRNVLSVYMRQGSLTLPIALEIQRAAQLLMADSEFAVDSEGVLRLSADSGCSAYDAEFVYLAQSEAVPLITSDRALLRQFPETAATPAAFAVGD